MVKKNKEHEKREEEIPFLRFLNCLEERVILILWICSWDSSKPSLVGFITAYAVIIHNHREETKK